jgi:hypothetical protein
MQKKYFILMADIIGSSKVGGKKLMQDFSKLVAELNKQAEKDLISPLTITLGDEFQGIVKSLQAGVNIIIKLEEALITYQFSFKLRYVLLYGEIETPINKVIAHGMLGKGLAFARQELENLKGEKDMRFYINTGNSVADNLLNNLFYLYQSIVDNWMEKEYELVRIFWEKGDYKAVAEHFGKVNSLMWKRERSLKLKEYKVIKDSLELALTCK